jgi:hypothetical protein
MTDTMETLMAAAPLLFEELPVALGPLEEAPELRLAAPEDCEAPAPLVGAAAPLPLEVGDPDPEAETASVKSADDAVLTQLLEAAD